jgi:hypothetical protein
MPPDKPLSAAFAGALASLSGAKLESWMAETSIGSYPLEVVASSRSGAKHSLPAGAFAVLTVGLTIEGVPWLGATPGFVV